MFAGGCNVGINVDADKIIFNDNIDYLIELYNYIKNLDINELICDIEKVIQRYELSSTNEIGYNMLRKKYNEDKNSLYLFTLICYSFNHQIRFNNNHQFNCSFGKDRSQYNSNIKNNLIIFSEKLKKTNSEFICGCFNDLDLSELNENDFVYCDPPYLITTGSYNDGNRGFKNWTDVEEKQLFKILNKLNDSGIKFALSNVIEHKGNENILLKKFTEDYNINFIDIDYSNSNYQTKDKSKNSSIEVLITNYKL